MQKYIFQFFLPHAFKRTLLSTPACPAPSNDGAGWHSTTRTCAVLVVVATAMAAILLVFAEVVSITLALILVLYDTYVAFCHMRDDNSTDFETDGVSEGR